MSKETFEFQERVLSRARRAKKELSEEFEFSKSLEKNFSTIIEYIEVYELSYDTLGNIAEVLSKIRNQKELSTVEKEIKNLLSNFWD